MWGKVHVNKPSYYPAGYKVCTGVLDTVSVSNNGVINRTIPTGIIPLTFKVEWLATGGSSGWYINFGVSPNGISWNNQPNWSGGQQTSCSMFFDAEMKYGIDYLKTCKYYGGSSVNGQGTYRISIVKWLEPLGGNS